MSNFEKYDLNNNTQANSRNSCNINNKFDFILGASSIFQKIKSNLSNLIFLGNEDGIENKNITESNDVNKIYDAPTLELNMSQELENPIHINTNTNLEYINKNINDTRVRKFSLDSSRTNHTKKKSNPINRIVQYITEKKFSGKDKTDLKNSGFIGKFSAFKPIDNRNKLINLNSKKIINCNDFFEVLKDKNLIKPIPMRRNASEISQIAKKRNRSLDNSFFIREEEKINENGVKRRKIISDDDRSLFSSVQNLNKIRNLQRDDVSMKSMNSVMSYKFIKEDKDKNILEKNASDDISMNIIVPENKSIVKSFYSKTLDEIKSEIEEKRGKNLRMLDEISRKSKISREEKKMDYEEKKKFLNNYYKEKEKNFKEMDLLSKGGKISLNESDLNKDRNLSYSKSSMMIESAPKKNKNVDIVKSSNFDICSNKSAKLGEEKESPKEFLKKTNENLSQNLIFGQDKKVTFGDSNALTDKKINPFGDKIELKDKTSFFPTEIKSTSLLGSLSTLITPTPNITIVLNESEKSITPEEKPKEFGSVSILGKELEKKEEKSGLFGLVKDKDIKSGLFGNVEKKDDNGSFSLLENINEEKPAGLFDKIIKNQETTSSFKSLFDKQENKSSSETKAEKEEKVGTFFNLDKKEEKPITLFGQQDKNEEKPNISFGLNKTEEQKNSNLTLSSAFSFSKAESTVKKTEQDQQSSSLFATFIPKTNSEDKSLLKEKEPTKPTVENPLFSNKDTRLSTSFAYSSANGTPNFGGTNPTSQSLFGGFKEEKDEKTTLTFGLSNENNSSMLNLENKDKDSKETSTTTSKLFGNLQGTNQTSLIKEPQKTTTSDTSSAFFKKDQSATSLVNEANPFLKTYGIEQKAPTIFQSPNTKPGINIFNSISADGMVVSSMGTSAFNSGLGMNKIASSSINNSNRSGDIYENLDKNTGNKSFPMTTFSSTQNLSNSSNPFFPKGNLPPKADIFSDHNESMAISPITSPKVIPKNDDIKPNLFHSMGTLGGSNTNITTSQNLFGNNVFPNQLTTSTSNSNNPFLAAANTTNTNNLFSNPNPTSNINFGSGSGLFSTFTAGNLNTQPANSGLFGSTGGPIFNIGKK